MNDENLRHLREDTTSDTCDEDEIINVTDNDDEMEFNPISEFSSVTASPSQEVRKY